MPAGFLVTYGPAEATIFHPMCGKSERVYGTPGSEPTPEDFARCRRVHVCGPADDGWDVPESGEG